MDLRAVIFVPALAGSVICAFIFLLFAANYFLTVMESGSVGAREVTWHSEPIVDNAGKLAYLAWLVGLWLGPAYFIGRAITADSDSAWLKLAVPILVFWICYPISQLSSLSASTIWLPLVPDVFVRILQRPLVMLGFQALSLVVLAVFAVAFRWAFLTNDEWKLLFVGAPLMVVSGFMYAMLIGRLAFALRFTKSLFGEKKEEKTAEPVIAKPVEDKQDPYFTQPSDLPPIGTPDDGDLAGYNLKFEEDRPPEPKKIKKRLKAEIVEDVPANKVDATGYEAKFEDEVPPESKMAKQRITAEPVPDEDDDSTAYSVTFDDDPKPEPKKKRKPRSKSDKSETSTERQEAPRASSEETRSSSEKSPEAEFDAFPRPRRRAEPRSKPERGIDRSRVWSDEDDEPTKSYGVHESEVDVVVTTPKSVIKPSEDELRLIRRDDAAINSKRIWSSELLVFLVQPGTVSAILTASFLCLAAGTMVRIARIFNPAAGAGPD